MQNRLSESERKTLLAWIIVGIVIFVVAIGLKLTIGLNKHDSNKKDSYTIVKDQNRYYTVNGAITKYYAFLNDKNYDSILHILDETYRKENKITKENITNYITDKDSAISFQPGRMCSKEIEKGITSYLVKGKELSMNTSEIYGEKYYEIILDGNQFLFSLSEVDSEYFGGHCHGQS